MWQAAGRVRGEPPTPGDGPADYLVRLARSSHAGTLLILDHLETILANPSPDADRSALDQLGALLLTVSEGAGSRLRILLCVETGSFHRLDSLYNACNLTPAAGAWMELGRLNQESATQILEQTAVGTGTFFEAGLASLMAGDLCRSGPCLPADLQIVARMAVELRLTSLRRYERSGGAAILLHSFFQRAVHGAGGTAGVARTPRSRPSRKLNRRGTSNPRRFAGGRGRAGGGASDQSRHPAQVPPGIR